MIDRVCIVEAVSARSRIRDLAVDVEGEQVTLRGKCFSFYQKQLAQEAARSHTNGCELQNEIKVSRLETD